MRLSTRCVIIHVHVCSYLSLRLRSDRTLSRPFIRPRIDDWRLLVTETTVGYKRPFLQRVPCKHSRARYMYHTITYAHLFSIVQPLWQFSPTVEHDATRNARRFHVSRKKMSYGVHDIRARMYVYSRGVEKRVIIIGCRGS